MQPLRSKWTAAWLLCAQLVAGCHSAPHSTAHVGKERVKYYKDVATSIDYPHVGTPKTDTAARTEPPRRIREPRIDDLWDLSLEETVHLALANNQLIRSSGQFLSPGNPLVTNPDAAPSIFDPAIQESGVLFGQRGVEAALADFDAQFTTSMLWSRNEEIQNNMFLSGGLDPGTTLQQDAAVFNAAIEKQMAYGGSFSVSHGWNYSYNNSTGRLFPSAYAGFVRADYRHPLWAGAGTEFTRIAGPIGSNIRGITGVNQGVVIARINSDISLADFELSVRNLVIDVEDAYWDLGLAYHVYDAELIARNSALATWRDVKALSRVGAQRGSAADEAQALDNYLESKARTQNALADLYELEGRLRRLMGLPVNDGKIIRPIDKPVVAEFLPDWHLSLAEALVYRTELRRQKWNIKSLQLQLKAARSLTQPRLDFVSGYQANGFGDRLFGRNDDDGVTRQGLDSGYETLTQGDQTGWNLGVELSMPFGLRAAHTQVRNVELRLAKAQAGLAAQELEISHELSNAFQALDRWYATMQTNFNRRRAAARRVQAFQAEFDLGQRITVDLLLRAQISLAQAEIAYFRSLYEYNKAIIEIHNRKGTLLAQNNVFLGEGSWHPHAYAEALQRARDRTHACPNGLVHTEPSEFVSPGGVETVSLAVPLHAPEFDVLESPDRDDIFDGGPPGDTELAPPPDPLDEQTESQTIAPPVFSPPRESLADGDVDSSASAAYAESPGETPDAGSLADDASSTKVTPEWITSDESPDTLWSQLD